MYRPSLAVTAVVLLLTLVCTTGASSSSGPGLPPKVCKLRTSKAKCLELRAKGRCTKPNVFKKCQKVCDPRCQLGTRKPKCKNLKPDSFCKQKKHKCDKTHIMNKCKKTCGKCQVCDNRIDDAVCDLVSELGWCKANWLFQLCLEACDPGCKNVPCDKCEDTCVGNSAVEKTCGRHGVCVLEDITPCEDKCDGDKVLKHVCEDGKCVPNGVKKCEDKCYGDILVPVTCDNGKCKYGAQEVCNDKCDGDTAKHRTCDEGKCVVENTTECTDFCDGSTAVDVICFEGSCKEGSRTDCMDTCDGDKVVEVKCEGGQCEEKGRSLCEDYCDGNFAVDKVCSLGMCEDGARTECLDFCEGQTVVELVCDKGQCIEEDRKDCESTCNGDKAEIRECKSGKCELTETKKCDDQCDTAYNNVIKFICDKGECKMDGTTPCEPVCENGKQTDMVCDLVNGEGQCVMGGTIDCPCGCGDDGTCIPADQCCKPDECKNECKSDGSIQLKTCDKDECVDAGMEPCVDECVDFGGIPAVAFRECFHGRCICNDYKPCLDECEGDYLLDIVCLDGKCEEDSRSECKDRCEKDHLISATCQATLYAQCVDVASTPCKCGCKDDDVCKDDGACCENTTECPQTTCDATSGNLIEYFCENPGMDGECKKMETPCLCGCNGNMCADETSCCQDSSDCQDPVCDGGVLKEYKCINPGMNGECKLMETDCKCGCDTMTASCAADNDCCTLATEETDCPSDSCIDTTLTTWECLGTPGDCVSTTTTCTCGCQSGKAECEDENSCCVDDTQCGDPTCDSSTGILTIPDCNIPAGGVFGGCETTTEPCTCGCDASGMACAADDSCCLITTCPDGEVLQDPTLSSCACRECKNDMDGAAEDTGCEPGEPLCGTPGGNTADDLFGDACFKCIDDEDGGEDTGCDSSMGKPNCLPSDTDAPYGDECFFCINDMMDAIQDTGCEPDTPLCGTSSGELAADAFGDACFVCINDKGAGQTDTGCGGNTPFCVADSGKYGTECTCEITDVDLCISVDESGSISDSDWIIEKNFVINLVNAFEMQGSSALWGGNVFNANVRNIVAGFVDADVFTPAVNALTQGNGRTDIGKAINNCKAKLEDSNVSTSSNKVYILITDGNRNEGLTQEEIVDVADVLKATAEIFTIGAGTSPSTDNFLKDVASSDSNFFSASSVTAIDEILQSIISRVCATIP